MSSIDFDLIEALHKKMPKEMIHSLRVMEEQRQKHPNDSAYDPHDFQQKRAENILKCFRRAIEDGYVDGVFLLFDKKRAAYILENMEPYYDINPIAFKWFKKVVKTFEYDLNGVAQLWDAIVPAKNGAIDDQLIESIRTRVETAIEMVEPYEQKQRMLRAVEKREKNTSATHTKKM